MTDKEFMRLIRRTQMVHAHYMDLLKASEIEYEYRYGHNPSETDDDYWIDSMHQSSISMTIEEIEENANK